MPLPSETGSPKINLADWNAMVTLVNAIEITPRVVPVVYDAGWPTRPTVPTGSVVMWIGNPGGAAPPAMADNDIWTQG